MKLIMGKIPSDHACPRCSSQKTYTSDNDFFCLTCSLIIVEDEKEYLMHKAYFR